MLNIHEYNKKITQCVVHYGETAGIADSICTSHNESPPHTKSLLGSVLAQRINKWYGGK